MTEAVAVPKPGGKAKRSSGKSRTALAGVLVILLLVAFAGAVYALGGVDLAADLVGGLFAPSPQQAGGGTSAEKPGGASVPSTGSVEPTGSAGEAALPPGVDELFARRGYAEQIESQANIAKLVNGDVESFAFTKATVAKDRADIPLSVKFADGSASPGLMRLANKAGKWYLEWLRGERPADYGASADSVSRFTNEESPEHVAEAQRLDADEAVVAAMMQQQAEHQDVVSGLVDGKYTGMTVDDVTRNAGTAAVEVTFKAGDGSSLKGRVVCITKNIDGRDLWFITSFEKAQP